MIEKLDHIGIAVKDIDDALKFYSDALGISCTHIEDVEEQKVKTAFLPTKNVDLELLQPTASESALAKFLEKRGEGIQHIAFKVEDIEKALQVVREKGVELIDAIPRKGARGAKIAFLHPRSTHGVL